MFDRGSWIKHCTVQRGGAGASSLLSLNSVGIARFPHSILSLLTFRGYRHLSPFER